MAEGTLKTVTLNASGKATIVLGPFDTVGTKYIVVAYSGSSRVTPDAAFTTVKVVNGKVT